MAGYSFDREIVASQFKFDYIKDSFIDLLIYVSATFKCRLLQVAMSQHRLAFG